MSEVNWELIVHRLDSIVDSQIDFAQQLKEIDEKVTKIETIKHSVDGLKDWKKEIDGVLPVSDMKNFVEWKCKIDEVVSPTQLKEHIKEIENLKTFKTKSTMIWVVVQAMVFILYFLDRAFDLF
jgi:hypothetical protein